jgi:hypothetical protein
MATQASPEIVSSSPDHEGPASILRLQVTNLAKLSGGVRSYKYFSAFVALTRQLEISAQEFKAVFENPFRACYRRAPSTSAIFILFPHDPPWWHG